MGRTEFWRRVFYWSAPRLRLWDGCKRAYYYQYLARWDLPWDDQRLRSLEQLSQLETVEELQASLVQDALEGQLYHHRLGREADKGAALAQFSSGMRRVRRTPRTYLTEVVNREALDPTVYDRVEEEGRLQIADFFDVFWPSYRPLKHLKHEKLERFALEDGIDAVIYPALVTNSSGNLVVTLWRSREDGDALDEEMGAGLLWAAGKYDVPLEKLKGEFLSLGRCKLGTWERDGGVLEELREVVLSEAEEMLRARGREDLPASPSAPKCRKCRFLTICEEGQQATRAAPWTSIS